MFPYKDASHVPGFEVTRFARHVVGNHTSIYLEILEDDIFDRTTVVISGNDGGIGVSSVVVHVPEDDIFNPSPRRRVVHLIEEHAQIDQLPLPEILDANVLEANFADQVAVPRVQAHASLVSELRFPLVENVEVEEADVFERIGIVRI